jgi:hypothetical protein
MSEKEKGFRIEVRDGDEQIFFFSILPEKIIQLIAWVIGKKEIEK